MATNVTKWRPDTCGCEIDYAWDSEAPVENRVHTLVASIPCLIHENLGYKPNDLVHYAAIVDENTRKNRVFAHAVETIAALTETVAGGKTRYRVEDYEWVFDARRDMKFTLARGTQAQLVQVDAKVAADLGAKVQRTTAGELQVLRAELALRDV